MKRLMFLAFMTVSLAASAQQTLEGEWEVVASPFEGGEVHIPFTATASEDGQQLACHSDRFVTSSTKAYPIDWTIEVEQQNGKVRMGWVLDANTPASTEEYQESASEYALFGKDADGNPRYIYLLSENIETWQLEGMTLWSDWQESANGTFTLPRTYQIYATVSTQKPYNGSVGYIDIWASMKIRRPDNAAVSSIAGDTAQRPAAIYNLQGLRLNQPQRGLNIIDGRKVMVK